MLKESFIKLIGRVKAAFTWWKLGQGHKKWIVDHALEDFQLPKEIDFCHKDKVHIIVRGLADGKLHIAKNRNYSDLRFYKKQDLKVFCAVCRKRII